MTDLLFDLGNSRLKWARCRAGQLTAQHARPWSLLDTTGTLAALLPRRRPDRVLAVSVAGATREAWLEHQLAEHGLPGPRWLRSEAAAGGVRNGYLDPTRLGADRWLALLGAWHEAGGRGPLAVIDAGTATTLDWVDAQGRHRGGLILPGQQLMVASLLHGTSDIRAGVHAPRLRSRGAGTAWLARRTADAIEVGAALSARAAVAEWLRTARRSGGRRLRIFVTGGAAPSLMQTCGPLGGLHVPDLVLRGVAFRADC